ncbi:Superfamily I DNA or RNA helicase [Dyadobacter sp. SG02]|uniref:UvrD-helicase domain-containing protein n=1 Tax=Dyadobacter sp. SG02 TaxID=1855291 RepID=UPI0008C94FB0|nr:ATP-dependent helicase [Dyadobacter sp. SG02]SEJ53070.1 Superfamily I DNA or RNA helicase [Dyadobacter sp. SG02]
MRKVKAQNWLPADGLALEKAAMEVVVQPGNFLVVAGPGAGKTELLAQKAAFLLETNQCRYPRRVLAISFKKDAAFNLKERVLLRCEPELALRFDSMTFDTFAKLLLDRFRNLLPEQIRVSKDYEVLLADSSVLPYYQAVDSDYRGRFTDNQIIAFHTVSAFPLRGNTQDDKARKAAWRQMLDAGPSRLTFKMIMRLAEYIITHNEPVRSFLRQTYSQVFLDEFQDATSIQYEFFKSCFLGSDAQVTAVGDDKQRIMLWAGAKETVFEDFLDELSAEKKSLVMNFRCAPRLVALLNYLTEHLLDKSDFAKPDKSKPATDGECFLWSYQSEKAEMESLLRQVKAWMKNDDLRERQICILVKGRLDRYVGKLITFFKENGLDARDESQLQDLIAQDLVQYLIHGFYVIFDKQRFESKKICLAFLANVRTELSDQHLLSLETSFEKFTRKTRESHQKLKRSDLGAIVDELIAFAGRDRIKTAHPVYTNDAFLYLTISEFIKELTASIVPGQGIIKALDRLVGHDTIPVMTVHKSKGLEYHTVIFIGLEDDAFWNYQKQADEDNCTFFVALSRAKNRVVFTFSHSRPDKYGTSRKQKSASIKKIVDLLEASGLVEISEK